MKGYYQKIKVTPKSFIESNFSSILFYRHEVYGTGYQMTFSGSKRPFYIYQYLIVITIRLTNS